MEDNEMQDEGGLIDRIKESPRTVSALIIILIVAAAIYAFSGDEGEQVGETGEQAAVSEEQEGEATEASEEEVAEVVEGEVTGEAAGDTAVREPKVAAETTTAEPPVPVNPPAEPAVEAHRTNTGFVEVAEAGNGMTHLARKASARWLSENQVSYAVTDEHRIYIEDYIQNRMGTQGLALGASMEISFELIQEAVVAAGELNESQLKNLSQYTSALQ